MANMYNPTGGKTAFTTRKYGFKNGDGVVGNLTVLKNLTINGTLTFGNASVDNFIIKGRVSTMTAAGSAVDIDSTYTSGELMEMRATVSSWTGVAGSFKGYYFRAETTAANASYGLRGMEVFSVANITSGSTGLGSLQGLYVESALKHGTASWTLGGSGCAIEANIAIYTGAGTLTVTNDFACLRAKIGGANGAADYTKFNGIEVVATDGESSTRVFGDAIAIQDPLAGDNYASDWTNAIYIMAGCVTGINMAATSGTTDQIKLISAAGANALNIDAGTTDHTGATIITCDLDVNSAGVKFINADIDVGTALSSSEYVYGIYFDIAGAAGDNAGAGLWAFYAKGDVTSGAPVVGLELATAFDTGIIISAATTTGINITGNATDGIKIQSGAFTDAIDIAGTTTNGINMAACSTAGIVMAGGASYNPIHIGTKANAANSGLILTGGADDFGGILVFCDDGGAALSATTSPAWFRYLITKDDQSSGATATGGYFQLKTKPTSAIAMNTGSYTATKSFLEIGSGGVTLTNGAELAVINAGVGMSASLVNTSGRFSGIDVNINTSTNTITDTIADTAGIHIRKTTSSTYGWPVGLKINNNGATTGIHIGTCGTRAMAIGVSNTRAINIGVPYAGGSTSTGMKTLTDDTTWSNGAPVGFYFDDQGVALTAWGECFTVGQAVLTASTAAGQSGWPYTAFFYLDIEANITTATNQHWANVMTSAIIGGGVTVDGFTSHGVSSLHTSCDINGTLAANNTMSNISFGGNSTGTINGVWVCMHIRDTTGNFSAWTKFDTNAIGCYTTAYTGNDTFVANNKGTFTQAGQLRIMIGANTYYIPYGTVA